MCFFSFPTTPAWQQSRLGDEFPWKQLWQNVNRERRKFRARFRGALEMLPFWAGAVTLPMEPITAALEGTVLQHTRTHWWCGHMSPAPCSHLPSASGQPWLTLYWHVHWVGRCRNLCLLSQIPALPCELALRINGGITSCFILPSGATH